MDMSNCSQVTFSEANREHRERNYTDAIRLYDQLSQKMPRNHFSRLNAIMSCIAQGRFDEAAIRLAKIDNSSMLGERLIASIYDFLQQKVRQEGKSLPLNSPVDYYNYYSRRGYSPKINRISLSRKFPSTFPSELVFPELVGEGNDFGFVEASYNLDSITKEDANINVVILGENPTDIANLISRLRGQQYPRELISISVLCSINCNIEIAKENAKLHKINKKDFSLNEVNHFLNDSEGVNLVLSDCASPDPYLFARVARYFRVSRNLVLYLECNKGGGSGVQTLSSNQVEDWKRERYPFRRLKSPNFAIHSSLLSKVGKFESKLVSDSYSMMEIGYRAYNRGAYFLPISCQFLAKAEKLSVRSNKVVNEAQIFQDLCPVNWWRKSDGPYTIPKVSIYIPSYNNGKYILKSIDSVLNQDYSDVEVCICDDGSSDNTLELLERHFASNPKVRWIAAANGGIGHSSNLATEMTRGLYIGQLDSDDVLKPGAIKRLADYLDENPQIGCVYSSCERIDKDGNYIKNEYSFPAFSREKMMMTSIAHHFRMFRRQAWERTLKFRDDIMNAVDYDMFLKLSEVCRFYHIDEVYYQRRWHGNNTSFINEEHQSRNTHIVLNNALNRLGLGAEWEVFAPNKDEPRKVTYRRKKRFNRIYFWPDYSSANPYQKLLYGSLPDNCSLYSGDIDCAIKAVADKSQEGLVVFHLHWLNQFLKTGTSKSKYLEHTEKFLEKLTQFKKRGGKVVWTIHNVVSHEGGEAANWELEFVLKLLKIVDKVHIHSERSIPEIETKYTIPREKLEVVAHGSYFGYYPNYIDAAEARARLNLKKDDIVFCFVGQIRAYKGLDFLLESFIRLVEEERRVKLVIAGKAESSISGNPLVRRLIDQGVIRFSDGFVSDEDLQIFFNAANFSVFPYQNILTSGSVMLSLSFGVPVITPRVGMTSEVIAAGKNGFLYEEKSNVELYSALKQAVQFFDLGTNNEMKQASFNVAGSYDWKDAAKLFDF